MGLGDEQDRFGSSPSSNRIEKVPPAGGGVAPGKQCPRIIKQYAQIAKAIRQARQDRRRRSPCRRSSISAGSDVSALCIDRTGRGNNRIQSKQKTKKSKKKREQSKKQQNTTQAKKQQRKQANTQTKKPIGLLY